MSLESALEKIIAKKQQSNHNLAILLDQIIETEQELISLGIGNDLLTRYTSLQMKYHRNLRAYAYRIGYRRAKKGVR